MNEIPRFRRPARLDPAVADELIGGLDPAEASEVAHLTANALVHRVREIDDPDVVDRLVRLVETEGLDVVAALWSEMPANTLPGILWILYELQDGVRTHGEAIARWYRSGLGHAEVAGVIAGAADTMRPVDMLSLVDTILSGFFTADLAVALERAGAFCRVVATGAAFDADEYEAVDEEGAMSLTRGANNMTITAGQLEDAAKAWRVGRLT